MKIIIPMAGMGKRMRPHTLTVPKPLLPVAGKPIVYRLVEDLARMCDEPIEEIAFIIGRFGEAVEKDLIRIAAEVGATGSIYYQDEPLGTAHAILCAEPSLGGHLIVAFADTLFYADFKLDTNQDGTIWTSRIPDPSSFGVVETDADGVVKQLWEKPKDFVSDEAIIGIYYFKDGERLRKELRYLLDNDIKVKGEYQLTDALDRMRMDGAKFKTASVTHWLDCGNKDATVDTNKTVLELTKDQNLISGNAIIENSVIIDPCFIGEGAHIKNSIIGPYVSVGENTFIEQSIVSNSIIMSHSLLKQANLENAMIGNYARVDRKPEALNLGDYSEAR
jgi:glucose-1-phosphate thymidylyltransferase